MLIIMRLERLGFRNVYIRTCKPLTVLGSLLKAPYWSQLDFIWIHLLLSKYWIHHKYFVNIKAVIMHINASKFHSNYVHSFEIETNIGNNLFTLTCKSPAPSSPFPLSTPPPAAAPSPAPGGNSPAVCAACPAGTYYSSSGTRARK